MADTTKTVPQIFNEIATAIQDKKGSTEPINPKDFAEEIVSLPSGPTGDITINLTRTYSSGAWTVSCDTDYYIICLTRANGYNVHVNVDNGYMVGELITCTMLSSGSNWFFFDCQDLVGPGENDGVDFDNEKQEFYYWQNKEE